MAMTTYSRARGNSAVKAAAYRARTSFYDNRRGRRYSYGAEIGLLSSETIGWHGSAEDLWNTAEASETRSNARVARELRPALPAELPLPEQIKLVRGMCLWLRDTYGVASHAVIHAPNFRKKSLGDLFWKRVQLEGLSERRSAMLANPKITNKNFHAHILFTTRQVDPTDGTFGGKTRELDDQKDGPAALKVIRAEWEKRTNAALAEIGSAARIDMRSYADMASVGDAPEGLMAQEHLGARRTERSRKQIRDQGEDSTTAGRNREAVRANNEALWTNWALLRDLQRRKAREVDSKRIAADREIGRRKTAAESQQMQSRMIAPEEAEDVLASSNHLDSSLTGSPLAQALAAALSTNPDLWESQAGPSETLDVETFERQASLSKAASEKPVLEVLRVRVRQRVQ